MTRATKVKNQASAGSRTFTYNLANELASTTAASVTTSYGYDGDGRRVSSTVGGGGVKGVKTVFTHAASL
jgi:YD repeat-containing protein